MTDHRRESYEALRKSETSRTHEERAESLLRAQAHALMALAFGKEADSGPAEADTLLSIEEVAERTRVPVATLRYYRATERGPEAIKIGGRLRYRQSDVEAWIESEYARTVR